MMGAMFSGEQKFFWTNLRLFVKENYLRSHRAPGADTKHAKSKNMILFVQNDINMRYYRVYCQILWFMVLWWEQCFLESRNFLDKSQIVCPGKLSEIPQRTRFWHETCKVRNTPYMCLGWHKIQVYRAKVVYFVIFGLVVGAEFFAEQKIFWTSLRLFVEKNYLRSHRAPGADTKHEKSEIHHICVWDGIKFKYIAQKLIFLWFLVWL